jgi:uncharacterized protein
MKLTLCKIKKALPWAIGGAAGIFALGSLATSVYIERMMVRPRRKRNRTSDLNDYVPEANYTTTPVEFHCEDGFRIAALLLQPGRSNGHAVLVCHGLAHNKNSGIRFVQYLLREGYTLLALDFRNHGDSDGSVTTYGYFEKQDLLAAVDFLQSLPGFAGRIGVLGASMGASIALQAAAETDQIHGLVLDSPFASLRRLTYEWANQVTHLPDSVLHLPMNLAYLWMQMFEHCRVQDVEPAEQVRQVECPVLLIHGSEDQKIPMHHSRDIFENAPREKDLWIVDGAGHLGAFLKHPGEYEHRVLQFFSRHLLKINS